MRLLLRYFNSGRIPFGFPDSSCVLALICMGGVLMLLKVDPKSGREYRIEELARNDWMIQERR